MLNMDEIIRKGLREGLLFWWQILKPYLITFIIGTIVIGIIKLLSRKIVCFFSMISGDTQRETRQKLKVSDNLIDLASAINDIIPKK